MCNGDLGMFRVMPWAYPTIPGQSSGGTSVDPTPEPVALPYDASGISVIFSNRESETIISTAGQLATFSCTVSGVEILDNSNVDLLLVTVTPESSVSVSPTTVGGDSNPSIEYSRFYLGSKNPNGTVQAVSASWKNATSGSDKITLSGNVKITFEAYDVNGNLIQTFSGVST